MKVSQSQVKEALRGENKQVGIIVCLMTDGTIEKAIDRGPGWRFDPEFEKRVLAQARWESHRQVWEELNEKLQEAV